MLFDQLNNWDDIKNSRANTNVGEPQVPENEEEILRFLDSAVLEEQPTEVLVQLAQKLKERRSKLYNENQNPQAKTGLGNMAMGGVIAGTTSIVK